MNSMPPSFHRIFEPLEALLADDAVEQIVLDADLAVCRAGVWAYRHNPLSAEALVAAVGEVIDALGDGADVLELALEGGARFIAMRPPMAARAWLAVTRPRAQALPALPGRATPTVEVALNRRLNLLIVGPDAADRQAWMTLLAGRDQHRAVSIDFDLPVGHAQRLNTTPATLADRLRQAALSGPRRLYWEATEAGAPAVLTAAAQRIMPMCVGVPGRTAHDGIFGLANGRSAAQSRLAAAFDLVLCVDGMALEEIVAISAGAGGPVLAVLQRIMPSGGLTDERAHADWMARWQRIEPGTPPASLPPQSLTDALRVVHTPAEPSSPRMTRRAEPASSTPRDTIDPLQALLDSLGDAGPGDEAESTAEAEFAAIEREVTVIQLDGAPSESQQGRTFSEILRTLGESGEGSMHVRRLDPEAD